MRVLSACAAVVALAWGPAGGSTLVFQSSRDARCTEWHQCRELALAAADHGEYETFHDLAWRAVQTGPSNDPGLMYLLARAQALSGRPHDALIMLGRLADRGVPSDAISNDDFRRTRQLAGWPELQARIERLTHRDPAGPVAMGGLVDAAAASTPTPAPAATGAVHFSTERFAVRGLAYDAVSRRFLFGDRHGRKLIVVADGSDHVLDLVRADSAGFREISALEIDATRGDLWVGSDSGADGTGALHKLQLVSGRPLKTFPVPADVEPVTIVDLAITPAGVVLVLDSANRRLLALRSGGTSLESIVGIGVQEPASVTAGGDERTAYVAHRDGVSRIDLRTRAATLVAAPNGGSLARCERIRWYRHSVIAVQLDADGSRRVVRFELNASGSAVTSATTIDASIRGASRTFVSVSGDELIYLADRSSVTNGAPVEDPATGRAEFIAYRVRLR